MSSSRRVVATAARHLSRRPSSAMSIWARSSSSTTTAAAPAGESPAASSATSTSSPAPTPSSSSSSSSKPAAAKPKTAFVRKLYVPKAPIKATTRAASTSMPASSSYSSSPAPAPAQPQPASFSDPDSVAFSSVPSPPQPIVQVDWANSFYGVSCQPVTETQFKALMAPLDPQDIEVKPDGIIYLPEIKYRRKLNEVFGPMGWGLVPKTEPVVGQNIVTREYALVVGGRFVAQAQGENNFFSPDQLPSAVEGCKSNALMRCCKDLGVAAELWDPVFIRHFKKTSMEEVWVEHLTTKKKRTLWYKKGAVEVAYPYKRAVSGAMRQTTSVADDFP